MSRIGKMPVDMPKGVEAKIDGQRLSVKGPKGELEHRPEAGELVCHACKLRYEIRDGIPVMLVDEAKPL